MWTMESTWGGILDLLLKALICVCGGRRMLAVIRGRKVARKILKDLGLPRHELSASPFRFGVVGKRGASRKER